MPYTRTIICLAASRRTGGFCYAGKDVQTQEWVRPISTRVSHEISGAERTLQSGLPARVLDVLQIEFDSPSPHRWQTENHIITATPWLSLGVATKAHADAFADAPQLLWENLHSTANGHFDELTEQRADGFQDSLRLIQVNDLVLSARIEGGGLYPARRALRARFSFLGTAYILKVTDPAYETPFRMRAVGEYHIGNATMCVSLSEPFNGMAFKLVAAIT